MVDNEIIKSFKKQISKGDLLLKKPKIDEWKSRKATNITLLNNVFGKNNEYSHEFQKMKCTFSLSWDGIPDHFEIKYYNEYISTGKTILSSALDIYETGISFIPPKNSKTNSQKGQTITVKNTNIVSQSQNQTMNIDIKSILKDELTGKQFQELENIIKEKSQGKLKKFLENLKIATVVELLKSGIVKLFF